MALEKKERALLVKLFYQNGNNLSSALREYRRLKGLRKGPMSRQALKKMMTKFEETGELRVLQGRGRKRISQETAEEVALAVVDRASASQYSVTSARAVSRDLSLPWSTVRKILRAIIKWYPYKIHVVQALNPSDPEKRTDFARMFLARIAVDKAWPWNILWTDEAHFTLEGVVNTQNCRIWGTARPTVVHEESLHADYITVWCGFNADFILGPFFFEETTSQGPKRCSITGTRYCDLLQQKVIPALQDRQHLQTTVFMQDGAPPHIARPVTALLRDHFGDDRIISRSFPTTWPPRSPDLNPCDFWLWGFLKDRVYGRSIRTVADLKASITRHVAAIDRETLRATIEHAITRFEHVLDVNGMHIEHVL